MQPARVGARATRLSWPVAIERCQATTLKATMICKPESARR